MNFFQSLLSADGEISSKRFAGLLLILNHMAVTIIGTIKEVLPVEIESLSKVGLYTGAVLLGVSFAPQVIKAMHRPVPVTGGKGDEGTN